MRRRELMLLLGGPLATARALRAQQKTMPVIGYLIVGSPGPTASYVAAFRQGLSEAGYTEGQDVAIEYRWAEYRYDRLPALAADLVGRKVDVIAAVGGAGEAQAAKTATSTIRSSSPPAATRSSAGWSPVLPGRAATSRVSPSSTWT